MPCVHTAAEDFIGSGALVIIKESLPLLGEPALAHSKSVKQSQGRLMLYDVLAQVLNDFGFVLAQTSNSSSRATGQGSGARTLTAAPSWRNSAPNFRQRRIITATSLTAALPAA